MTHPAAHAAALVAGALAVSPLLIEQGHGIPARATQAYVAAAEAEGCDWRWLAAVGWLETDHGRIAGLGDGRLVATELDDDGRQKVESWSTADAGGPMGWLPEYAEAYVPGDLLDIDDAARGTCRLLLDNGMTDDPGTWAEALGRYNGGSCWSTCAESLDYQRRGVPYIESLPAAVDGATAAPAGGKDRSFGAVANRWWGGLVTVWTSVGGRTEGRQRDQWQAADDLIFGAGDTIKRDDDPVKSDHAADPDGLDPALSGPLRRMIADAPGSITVNSGRRTPAEQLDLWESSDRTGVWVAWSDGQSCTSMHCRGLAADLAFGPGMQEWAHDNAARYDLCFPMSWEPWHIEPCGAR